MIRLFKFIDDKLLGKRLDFRVRLFNMMAMAGILLGSVMAVTGLIINAGPANFFANFAAVTLAFGLIWYAYHTGRYQLCYLITVITVFLGLFPILFFSSGGYHGGTPCFFIFAVLFTIFMLDGKKLFVISAIEIAVYIGVCLIAYWFPQTVYPYQSEWEVMSDIVVGFNAVSIALGITMFIHFRLYNQQQRELSAAREEALRLSEAKSNFLANMSHEIRTPINVILGMNEMILRESGFEEAKGFGQNIQNAGKTLLLLIDKILDLSKIESGKLAVIEENYDTATLINDLSLIGAEFARKYELSFQTEVDESLPRMLTGDFIHIKQVVANFLSNAAKYTKTGGVTLSFTGKQGVRPDEIMLIVAVADTGIGIERENIPVLFNAFTRVDLPSNRSIEGTGLGLAIAKELTELMGGRIRVDSELGKGSIFSVDIPQKAGNAAPIGKTPRPVKKEEKSRTGSFIAPGGSVLVVDDYEENIQVIRSLLSRTLMRVDAVTSGAECLDMVKDVHYDIILMDYMMPGMDGAKTLARLKEISGFDTPVVALTANVVAGVKQKLLSAGFAEYLSKPVMWKDLESTLMAFLPRELIIPNMTFSDDILPDEERDHLARGLLAYGVTLDNGLRYLSGDIIQYKKLAAFFIENYEPGRREISDLAGRKDWDSMKFCIHSLKSKARAIGADDLSATAAKLESLCATGDNAYIAVTIPMLYYEWERARNGLTAIVSRLDEILPETEKPDTPPVKLEELAALLKHNRQPDALDILDRLISGAGSMESKSRLREIRQKVDDVEFREAERLLSVLMGGEASGQ